MFSLVKFLCGGLVAFVAQDWSNLRHNDGFDNIQNFAVTQQPENCWPYMCMVIWSINLAVDDWQRDIEIINSFRTLRRYQSESFLKRNLFVCRRNSAFIKKFLETSSSNALYSLSSGNRTSSSKTRLTTKAPYWVNKSRCCFVNTTLSLINSSGTLCIVLRLVEKHSIVFNAIIQIDFGIEFARIAMPGEHSTCNDCRCFAIAYVGNWL